MSALKTDKRGVLVACPSCRRANRLRYEHLDRPARCAHCHVMLPPIATPVDASDAAVFDVLSTSSPLPVVVDFWASWCGPCRVLAPELEKLAAMTAGELLVVKVNTESAPDLAERFRIRSIPTLAVFLEGRELARRSGVLPADALREFVGVVVNSRK